MEFELAERMKNINPSAIREILKVETDITFSAGNPSPETFPAGEMAVLAAEIFEKEYATALQYSITEGYGPLRELTRARMRDQYGVGDDKDDIIIVSGGQQGIDLTAKCLVNEGDVVLCENPSFIGALNDFRSYRTKLVGIPMDDWGMDMEKLEQALKTERNVKVIYTIPTFQNPMGVTMPLERRKKLYELAVKYNVLILEDSPYFELRYSGEPVPAIKSLDTTGHVMFVGSYSKVVAPGIRVGFVIGQRDLVAKMTVAKQGQDVHSNLFFMMLVARFLERYDLDAHIGRCVELYRGKRDRMLAGLDRHLDGRVHYTRPQGGVFIWGQLPDGYTGLELCQHTLPKSLAIVPGMTFDAGDDPENPGFRLNFSVPGLEEIDRGTALLGEAVREYIG